MAKEEKPLEYKDRIVNTKSVAQRIDLDYLTRPSPFRDWRRRLMWIAPAAAALGILPFLLGVGSGERAFSNGPVSRSHVIFENNCAACHAGKFTSVADAACRKCHDGPSHPAKAADGAKLASEPRCAQCHLEHRGRVVLAEVDNRNCTACHSDLTRHGTGVKLASTAIHAFRPNRHPEFPAVKRQDLRPLKLNHAVHMPPAPKTIRDMKLPMKCGDCHSTRLESAKGDLAAVTFEDHCRSCHKRELEFDVYQLLGASYPAPHTKDVPAIHQFIVDTYTRAATANPAIVERPLGREFTPITNQAAWLARVVKESEDYLLEKKCLYCHESAGRMDDFPAVKTVQKIFGRYVEGRQEGEPWLVRGEFSHRAHRAVDCASCHTTARESKKTGDVLIPKMEVCLSCHGSSGAHLDRCSTCHLYHNKRKELDKDRRSIEQLVGD